MSYEVLKPFLAAFVRWALTALASMLAAHGLMSSSGTEQFIGFGTTLAGLAWSWWEKSGRAAVAADIANLRAILAARAAAARAGAPISSLPPLQPGGTVAVPPQAVAAATVAKAVGGVLLAVLLLAPGDARAQDRNGGAPSPRPRPEAAPQFSLPDPLHLHDKDATPSGGTQGTDKLASILAKPFNDLADFINSDTAAAASLAVQIPDLQDGHGQACWMAMGQFTSVLHAHPIPVTLHAATDLEAFRLAAMAANNLCHNASCNQIFTDLANSIQKAAPVNLGIPIPSLSSLCAYVPQVTVVPGVPQPNPPAAPVTPPADKPNP